jgi:nucleotide-binding universal stress UspA family protein
MDEQTGRIVVAYDGSATAGAAVDWAASEAQRSGQQLTVLHVQHSWNLVPVGPTMPGPDRIASQGAARAGRLAATIDIQAGTATGQVSQTLINASREANLIVVGTRGHGELTGIVLGSVAFTVSAHAHCPVVVVRGDSTLNPGPECPVVVGVDGSHGSQSAVGFATDYAARTQAPLTVVTAYRPETTLESWGTEDCDFGPSAAAPSALRADAREAAAEVSQAAVRLARELQPQLTVRAQVVLGTTVGQLCTTAHRAGLLVVGTRSRDGFAGLPLGSVGHGLIHAAPCPVAVVSGPPR